MRSLQISALSFAFALPGAWAADWPSAVLDDGVTKVEVALPDAEHGYYRGSRFDWGGQVTQMTWQGRTHFAELKTPHDPLQHDHAAGPTEEFGMDQPPGWAAAEQGGSFIKIGIGRLAKDGPTYRFMGPYKILALAPWTTTSDATSATFVQDLPPAADGFAYRYTKTLRLLPGGGLALEHALENHGSQPIITEVYNHAMIRLGSALVGRGYQMEADQPIVPANPLPPSLSQSGTLFTLTADIPPANSVWAAFHNIAAVRCLTVHGPAGGSLAQMVDLEPAKVQFYAESTAICPEMFLPLNIQPGASASWSVRFVPGP